MKLLQLLMHTREDSADIAADQGHPVVPESAGPHVGGNF